MKLRHSTLAKFVISYILVLAVAFVGFYSVVRFQLQNEYKTTYRAETENRINNITTVLSRNFSNILSINYIIDNNMIFINARYSESPYLRYLAVNELKKLTTTNGLLQDILYLDIQNSDSLAANSTTFCKNGNFYIKTSSGDLLVPEELVTGTECVNSIYVLHTGGHLFYLFGSPRSSTKFRTLFVINENYLESLINLYATQEINAVGILSSDSLVYSTTPNLFPSDKNFHDLPSSTFLMGESGTELYIENVGTLRFSIVAQIDPGYYSNYATKAFEKSYKIMGMFLVVGILLICAAMWSTYVPLHDLVRRITKRDTYISNDIQALERAFDQSLNEKESLETQIDYYKHMIKKSIQTASPETEMIFGEQIDMMLNEDFHGAALVAILSFPKGVHGIEPASCQLPPGWFLTVLVTTEDQQTVFMALPSTDEKSIADVQHFFGELCNRFSCSVAYSDFSSNPLEIARLYDMAKQAQLYSSGSAITSYASIQAYSERREDSYPYQVFDDFSICLRKQDFTAAATKIDEIIQMTAHYPHIIVRCVFLDILTLLNTSMNANSIRFDKYKDLFIETMDLCRSQDLAKVQKTIHRNISAILAIFKDSVADVGIQLPQVTRFVEENCFRVEFSLAYLADHFNVSSVYMSSFFTKRMNINLIDYVWELRLQRAKYLLETTDTPIDKIALTVGYEIPSSFRRKFKQEMGISPSEYRKQHCSHQ